MNTPFFQLRWQQLHHPALTNSGDELWICHLDCQVQAAAGNKWLKLKYHIRQIQQHGHQGIVTFGGAFSNHLAAVAAAGNALGFTTKAIVRAHVPDLTNPTLQQCVNDGMELIFVEPSIYRKRHEPQFLDTLQSNIRIILLYLKAAPENSHSQALPILTLHRHQMVKLTLLFAQQQAVVR